MKILALEPYFGGSHRAFLDGWSSRSRHDWTILTLPAYRWKWRMRHAGWTFAEQVRSRLERGDSWDLLFCSDMLNLPEFLGLVPPAIRDLPSLAYFHENQLTYPDPYGTIRDWHYRLANLITALAATSVWFNSQYHLDVFLKAITDFAKRMPDSPPDRPVEQIRPKSAVYPQGIEPFPSRGPRPEGPLRILWAARWEHDKGPETFFEALEYLKNRGIDFRLVVLGQVFKRAPVAFEHAQGAFHKHIEQWGFLESPGAYRETLMRCDVFVSTALHEFFGISAAEAIAAGNYPLLPRRLAYPELLTPAPDTPPPDEFFYEGSARSLADALAHLAARMESTGDLWRGDPTRAQRLVDRFRWDDLAPRLDEAVGTILAQGGVGSSEFLPN